MDAPDLDWKRLIGELVAKNWDMRFRPTQLARDSGIGEATWRAWFRGGRGKPRGENVERVLAYVASVWPDYRERFRTNPGPGPGPKRKVRIQEPPEATQPRNERHASGSAATAKRRRASSRERE